MKKIKNQLSKLLEVLVTPSEKNNFFSARIKLTLLYTFAFFVVIAFLSAVLYYLFAQDIHEDMSAVFEAGTRQVEIINQHKGAVGRSIIFVDFLLLILMAVVSYYIAGVTILPIKIMYESQKKFLADASHELRTPLAILNSSFQLQLREQKLSKKEKEIINSNLEEVDRMVNLLDDLLMLSRLESHQQILEFDKENLFEIVLGVVKKMKLLATQKDIEIKIINESLDKNNIVNIDKPSIERVIFNIIKNSINYSHKGTKIEVKLNSNKKYADIIIIDQGLGMTSEQIAQIYNRYQRFNKNLKDGFGLGMPITKAIINQHRGEIKISSKPNKGTKVRVFLPLYKSS